MTAEQRHVAWIETTYRIIMRHLVIDPMRLGVMMAMTANDR